MQIWKLDPLDPRDSKHRAAIRSLLDALDDADPANPIIDASIESGEPRVFVDSKQVWPPPAPKIVTPGFGKGLTGRTLDY